MLTEDSPTLILAHLIEGAAQHVEQRRFILGSKCLHESCLVHPAPLHGILH
jgi:hypothetical protein